LGIILRIRFPFVFVLLVRLVFTFVRVVARFGCTCARFVVVICL